jgi:hypothetical protein
MVDRESEQSALHKLDAVITDTQEVLREKLESIQEILATEIGSRKLARTPYTTVDAGDGRPYQKMGIPLRIEDIVQHSSPIDLMLGEDGTISKSDPRPGYPYGRRYMPLQVYMDLAPEVLRGLKYYSQKQKASLRYATMVIKFPLDTWNII